MSSAAAQAATSYQRTFRGRADQIGQVRHDIASHLAGHPAAEAAEAVKILDDLGLVIRLV